MLEFNIAPNTQIGKVNIDHQVYSNENAYNIPEDRYSRGGEFLDNFVSDNIIEFSKRWLHLGGVEDVLDDIDEYFSKYSLGNYDDLYYGNSPILPTLNGNESDRISGDNIIDAIVFDDQYNRPEDYTFNNIQKGLLSA